MISVPGDSRESPGTEIIFYTKDSFFFVFLCTFFQTHRLMSYFQDGAEPDEKDVELFENRAAEDEEDQMRRRGHIQMCGGNGQQCGIITEQSR